MYKSKKTKVIKPMNFNNHDVGIHQCYNQHNVERDIDKDKKVTMKQVFGVAAEQRPKKSKKA